MPTVEKKYFSRREALTGLCFVLPGLIYILAVIGYPMIYNVILSFQNWDVSTFRGQTQVFVGLDNYRHLFNDSVFLQALWQTFIFTIACLVIQFSIGFLLALFFTQKFPLSGMIRGTVVISYMMPMVVTAIIFQFMFQTHSGMINHILLNLRIIRTPIEWLVTSEWALISVIIANSWVGIPFNMLLLTAGMSNVPKDVYESASIDGANWFQRLFQITMPMIRPAILACLMLGFIYTFRIFDLILIMTDGGPVNFTQVLSTYSYRLQFGEFRFSLGSASAVVLFLCLMVVGFIYLWLIRREEAN